MRFMIPCLTMSKGGMLILGSNVVMAILNCCSGRTMTCWLSSFPWSTPGSHERASGGILVFPGI